MSDEATSLLRKDTPVDLLRSSSPVFLTSGQAAIAMVSTAFDSSEELQSGFESWMALRAFALRQHQAVEQETKRIEFEEKLLSGAMLRLGTATAENAGLSRQLNVEASEIDSAISELSKRMQSTLFERVARTSQMVKPQLTLFVRNLGTDRSILHLGRLSEEEALVVMYLFCQKIPSRYGAHLDDSTDDLLLEMAHLFGEEQVTATRLDHLEFVRLLEMQNQVVPVKACIPMKIESGWVRWVTRGPVLEAEIIDANGFRNILTQAESERVTAQLIKLKIENKIELELGR